MKSIDALDTAFTKHSDAFDDQFQQFFEALGKDYYYNNYFTNDKVLSASKLKESELFAEGILKLMKNLSGDAIHSMITKVLPNGFCGSQVTKNQAIMMFYDYVMFQVIKQQLLLMNLHHSMMFITGGLNLKKKFNLES